MIFMFDLELYLLKAENIIRKHNVDMNHEFGIYHKNFRVPISTDDELFYTVEDNSGINLIPVKLEEDIIIHEQYINIVDSKNKVIATYTDIKNSMVSTLPFNPIMSARLLRELFYIHMYRNSDYKDLLVSNPLLDNGGDTYMVIDRDFTEEEIVEALIPTISDNDKYELLGILSMIFDSYILDIIKSHKNLSWELNVDGLHVILKSLGDVRSLRFQEAIDHKIISDEVEELDNHEYNIIV